MNEMKKVVEHIATISLIFLMFYMGICYMKIEIRSTILDTFETYNITVTP